MSKAITVPRLFSAGGELCSNSIVQSERIRTLSADAGISVFKFRDRSIHLSDSTWHQLARLPSNEADLSLVARVTSERGVLLLFKEFFLAVRPAPLNGRGRLHRAIAHKSCGHGTGIVSMMTHSSQNGWERPAIEEMLSRRLLTENAKE